MSERSDARLIADADTDPAAFRALYDRYAASVFAVARKRTGDRESALDITAETFAQAWQSVGASPTRAAGRPGRGEVSVVSDWLDGLEEEVEAALSALPPAQRRAVELRVIRDQDYAVVAAELGCSTTAARIKVSRGLSGLRARLDPTQPQEQTP